MRIVFVSWRDLAHPQAGGAEVVLDGLARGLQARGHEVQLLCGGPVAERSYPVHRTGGTYTQYLRAPFTYWRRAGRATDVVVDVGNGIPYFSPLWQRAPVVCLVHHIHTLQWRMSFPAPIAAVGRWLESRAMPRVYRRKRFVAVSDSTRQGLIALGVDDQRVTTIVMGTNSAPVHEGRSSTPRFLILGRLVPHKRVALALELWERVRPRTGGSLVVVGDGPELPRLRAMAGADVEFTGPVDEARKQRELGAAWLLVHPAHHEGWGTVVMEAAAAGVPTVGFDVAGVRDSVADGVTGILATDGDEFAEAWVHLATNADVHTRMSAAAASAPRASAGTRRSKHSSACSPRSLADVTTRGSAAGTMRAALRHGWAMHAVLAVAVYPALLLTRRGAIAADSKQLLFLDAGRFLARAPYLWDPTIGMGTVTHQNIGYLLPMGPWFWATEQLGIPVWASQRLWLGTVMFAGGAGVLFLARTLRWSGPGPAVAALAYALSPFVLQYATHLSVLLLPYAALPWLVGFALRAVHDRGWRWPAWFALAVALSGSVNATALVCVLVGPTRGARSRGRSQAGHPNAGRRGYVPPCGAVARRVAVVDGRARDRELVRARRPGLHGVARDGHARIDDARDPPRARLLVLLRPRPRARRTSTARSRT